MQARLHRWRFNLVTGHVAEEQLSDSITEFGMINSGPAGTPYRYTYAATGKPSWFLFDGLVKHDLHAGSEQRSHSRTACTAAKRQWPRASGAQVRTTGTW